MSRPARNRLLVVVVLVVVFALAPRLPTEVTWVMAALGAPLVGLAMWVTTPFRRARAALSDERFDDAVTELRAFEAVLGVRWKRALAAMSVGFYTSNPEAAARSTLGAVRLEQKDLAGAKKAFEEATAMDAAYAIPWANLSVIAAMEGDKGRALELREKAKTLGFSF